jgi:tetratricopeptide (TPR) repeat protein
MPERWEQIKSVFCDALDLPKEQRSGFLNGACAGDPEMRSEVEKLLAQTDDTQTANIFDVPQHALSGGETLGDRFRILRFVGKGGMGEVYEAEDCELRGNVALKILRPELSGDPDFLTRFRREVQLARRVTHANICRVFDVGFDRWNEDSRVFLTMEFLDGETLAQHLRRTGPLAADAALPLVRQIAAGLGALHEQGIVHRDFKPGNVMVVQSVSGAARAVISDFGLARAFESDDGLTATKAVMGTPDYMAPEQLAGKSATPASDIYALGLVIREMVTGKKSAPPRGPTEGVNLRWKSVIDRCLEQEPENRPQSAAEVVAVLEGSVVARRAGRPRSRLWMAAAAAAIILAGIPLAPRLREWVGLSSGVAAETQQLALLPVKTLTDDPALRVFSEGLMETITSRMSQFERGQDQVMVVPASEVRSQGARTAGEARQKFHVNVAVEGSLEVRGDRLRLLLTVIDTRTMRQLETITVEQPRGSSWRLQDAAVSKLSNTLNLRLQPKYAREQEELSPIEPGAYEFYLQARGYLQRNDQPQSVASAVTLLRKAIDLDAKFALAHSALGRAYLYQFLDKRDPKLMEAAFKSGTEAVTLNPDLTETNVGLGFIYYGTGRYAEARERFEKAISLDARNHEAYQGLAQAYNGLHDYANAEATYLKAISLRPDDWTGYKALGLFYYGREDYAKAAAQFRKVVELTPDNAQGYANLGAALFGQQDWDGAERAWLRALDLDPKHQAALGNLGKLYFEERGQNAKAIEMYQRTLALSPRGYRTWGLLGRAYARNGEREKSKQALQKAVELIDAELLITPQSESLTSQLAFYRALLGRKDFAEAVERALRMAPDRGETLLRAAETYAIAGDRKRATELLEKALAHGIPMKTVLRSEYLKDLGPVVSARK